MTRVARALAAFALGVVVSASVPALAQETQASNLDYTGATSAPHASDLAAAATLSFSSIDPESGNPTEMGIEGEELTFTVRDAGGAEIASETAFTDANGAATAALRLNAPVGAGYTIEVAFAGDELFGASSAGSPVTINTAQTKLTVNGSGGGVRGQTINLGAILQHVSTGEGVEGRQVRFTIPGLLDTTVVTAPNGQATVSFPLTATYGAYQLTVRYTGGDGFAGTSKVAWIGILWTWTFTSEANLGLVYLNDLLNEFRVVTPSADTGVVTGAEVANHTPGLAAATVVTAQYAGPTVSLSLLGEPGTLKAFEATGNIGSTPFAMYRTGTA